MPPDSYWKDTGEYPPFRKQLKSIDDPIAEESFTYRNAEGKRVTSRVVVGRPEPTPSDFGDEWYCPVIIEGWYVGIKPIMSLGPVGALVNAGTAIKAFLHDTVFLPETRPPKKRPSRKADTKQKTKKATAKQSPQRPSPRKRSPKRSARARLSP